MASDVLLLRGNLYAKCDTSPAHPSPPCPPGAPSYHPGPRTRGLAAPARARVAVSPHLRYLPDLTFFAKDARGRLMVASRRIYELYGLSDDRDLIGLTDFDLNPDSMAQAYTSDDERLLSGKVRVIERLELWFDRQGLPDWAHVTKLPLKDSRGRTIGVMGVLRPPDTREQQFPAFNVLSQAVLRMRHGYGGRLTIESLAGECGFSIRAMQRQFQRVFGLTPQEFLIKTRVAAACPLLRRSARTLSQIAAECGFADQSSFTQHFRHNVGMTPGRYRNATV